MFNFKLDQGKTSVKAIIMEVEFMRKSRSAFLTIAVLGWLLIPGASPAWSYYPPVASTADSSPSMVTVEVPRPVRIGHQIYAIIPFLVLYPAGSGNAFVDLKQQNGVIAWVLHSGADYYVTCCTYDPALHPTGLTLNQQGPFTSVTQLQVVDGVVAYVVGIAGHSEPRYATYDPARQAWQVYGQNWYLSGMQLQSIMTKDGVVVYQYYWPGMPTPYAFDCWMYDPWLGVWGGSGMDNWDPFFLGPTINNATVNYAVKIPGTGDSLYGAFYFLMGPDKGWYLDQVINTPPTTTTPPQAYLVAQPTSGPAPLWVWCTDMSLGATSWSWNFGDGDNTPSRSTYHTYYSMGIYHANHFASHSIPVPAISFYDFTIRVTGAGIGALLPLLLD
jgi:hypothetical protein